MDLLTMLILSVCLDAKRWASLGLCFCLDNDAGSARDGDRDGMTVTVSQEDVWLELEAVSSVTGVSSLGASTFREGWSFVFGGFGVACESSLLFGKSSRSSRYCCSEAGVRSEVGDVSAVDGDSDTVETVRDNGELAVEGELDSDSGNLGSWSGFGGCCPDCDACEE